MLHTSGAPQLPPRSPARRSGSRVGFFASGLSNQKASTDADFKVLMDHVAHGRELEVHQALRAKPDLASMSSAYTDPGGRVFTSITPLQYVLWTLDRSMRMVIAVFLTPQTAREQAVAQAKLTQQAGHGACYDGKELLDAYDKKGCDLAVYAQAVTKAQKKTVAHVVQEYLGKSMPSPKVTRRVARSQSASDDLDAQQSIPRSQSDSCLLDESPAWRRAAITWDPASVSEGQKTTVVGQQLLLSRAAKVGDTDGRLIPLTALGPHTERDGAACVSVQMGEDRAFLHQLLTERKAQRAEFIKQLQQDAEASEAPAPSV